jgi:6-pyruvoyltetrahydropterin/6-carboxytetrahydropterin synthase
MSSESWSIKIHKDYLKFSAAHFLIFPDGSAERLHGHNYKVYAEVESGLDDHGLVLNFQEIKPLIREICDELDEHLLLPGEHPTLTAERRDDGQMVIDYQDRHYLIPADEVLVLPINNTSAENLACYVGRQVVERIRKKFPEVALKRIAVGVEETSGQQGVFTLEL